MDPRDCLVVVHLAHQIRLIPGDDNGHILRVRSFSQTLLETRQALYSLFFLAYLEIGPLLLDFLQSRLHRCERSGVSDAVDEQERVRRGDGESEMGETKGRVKEGERDERGEQKAFRDPASNYS